MHVPLDRGDIDQKNGLEIFGGIVTDSIVRGVPMNNYNVKGLLCILSLEGTMSRKFLLLCTKETVAHHQHIDF